MTKQCDLWVRVRDLTGAPYRYHVEIFRDGPRCEIIYYGWERDEPVTPVEA